MTRRFKVISNNGEIEVCRESARMGEKDFRHFQNVTSCVLKDALNAWADIWQELDCVAAHGCMVSAEYEAGFKPQCGWPEFLEKMWLLKHHLDYAKRFCEQGKKNTERA